MTAAIAKKQTPPPKADQPSLSVVPPVLAPIEDRISQLKAEHTVDQLRDLAKGLGLSIGSRTKEDAIARQIAEYEREGGSS